jgi:predicted PurR-regulated permease PerM
MKTVNSQFDIAGTMLAVLFIGILVAANFWVLLPFLTALLWAGMIVITTWPVLLTVQKLLLNKRGLAVAVMTAALLLVFIIPFTLAVVTVLDHSEEISNWTKSLATLTLPPPPEWIGQLPLIGPKLIEKWRQLASGGQAELFARISPYVSKVANWLLARAGSAMMLSAHFLLTVVISIVLYFNGEQTAVGVLRFARRLGGKHGEDAAILAAKAVRGVALGVVVTALVQSVLGGFGLLISGIPGVTVLTVLMFILCIAQVGPGLVLIPAVIWLFWSGETGWGVFMTVWTIVVGTIDNVIKPVLIRKGADLPLLLIFTGVMGGLIAFGVIGLFIGPVLLGVSYTLLGAWIGQDEQEDEMVS